MRNFAYSYNGKEWEDGFSSFSHAMEEAKNFAHNFDNTIFLCELWDNVPTNPHVYKKKFGEWHICNVGDQLENDELGGENDE